MNREIKFNIWDVDRQQYFRDVLSLEKDKINKWATLEKRTSNNIQWLQHTGYKDKNGKVIVEGDIVKYNKNNNDEIEVVDWDNLAFNLMIVFASDYNNGKCDDWIGRKIFDGIEIIGNIFENPELADGL